MPATIGWMELSASALRRLRQDLDPETEGVLDEMGVLGIHAGYANHFFPGTSVLQKRPRYLFFTCWNYLCLDWLDSSLPSAIRKDQAEDWVKQQLLKTKQKNVIGARVDRPAQPVDFIYWTALRSWGFYRGPSRSTLIQKWQSIRPRRVCAGLDQESDTVLEQATAAFFVKEPPHYWLSPRPRYEVTFDLTGDEARFLKARLESLPACILSAAASAAPSGPPRGNTLWEDELIREAARVRHEEDSGEPRVQRLHLGGGRVGDIISESAASVNRG